MAIVEGQVMCSSSSTIGAGFNGFGFAAAAAGFSTKASMKVIREFIQSYLHQQGSLTVNVTTLIEELVRYFSAERLGKLHRYGDCLKFLRHQLTDVIHLSKIGEKDTLVTWAPDRIMRAVKQLLCVHVGHTAELRVVVDSLSRQLGINGSDRADMAFQIFQFLKTYPNFFYFSHTSSPTPPSGNDQRATTTTLEWAVTWTPVTDYERADVENSLGTLAWECIQRWYPLPQLTPAAATTTTSPAEPILSKKIELTELLEEMFSTSQLQPEILLRLLSSPEFTSTTVRRRKRSEEAADPGVYEYSLRFLTQFTPYVWMKWPFGTVTVALEVVRHTEDFLEKEQEEVQHEQAE